MDLITLFYATCFVVLMLYQWYKNPEKFPPGPKGLPLVGSYPFVGKNPERTFKKWSQKYGTVMSVRMGMKNWVVLNDYDSVYEVSFTKAKPMLQGVFPRSCL